MPCYTVELVSVKFKAKNKRFLPIVAKELGLSYSESNRYINIGTATIDLEKEKITSSSNTTNNVIKRKYSEVALKEVERKMKWKLFKGQKQNTYVFQKF